jgi:hypothetical protein
MLAQKGHTNKHKRQQKAKLLAMLIATPDEILPKGLETSGFDHQLLAAKGEKRECLMQFRALYGLNPVVSSNYSHYGSG